MFKKIALTAAAAVTVTMLILSTVFYWNIAGFILMGLSFAWLLAEALFSYKRLRLFVLAPIIAIIVLGAVWVPIALIGMALTTSEVFFILGAIACIITPAYTWSK